MGDISGARVLVTGASGFLGRHVVAALQAAGAQVVPTRRRGEYDLRNEVDTLTLFMLAKPDIVVHLAATVGGIGANMARPATFFRDNLIMGVNVIHASAIQGAKALIAGTVCGYPRDCPVPFREEDFWNGYPEPTNAPYGIAKKSLLVMLQAYRKEHGLRFGYVIPTNLFGIGDNFEERTSHVIPALIRRFIEAKASGAPEVVCWGTGKATRSFLYVRDAAEAIAIACAKLDDDMPVNLPGSREISMEELVKIIRDQVGYTGRVAWDVTKPDGQPRRYVDGARALKVLGWKPETKLEDGLLETVNWYWDQAKARPEVLDGAKA